jgi:hypothetical protein
MTKQAVSLFFRALVIGIVLNLSIQLLAEPDDNTHSFFEIAASQSTFIVDR